MRESDITHENGRFWVYRDLKTNRYVVFVSGATHSTSDSAYPLTSDGLSLAVKRCDYLADVRPIES